ncbi:hypothetical protein N0V90_005273 [Kalmusia sp. IMI 367209]|nr:hypothetical protein N0V90_005273 [Kalmusia sp. IMI 367209]
MANAMLRVVGKSVLDRFADASHALQIFESSHKAETDGKLAIVPVDIQSERERFQLWAANLGIFVVGDRSLDYRIRDNPTVKEYTGRLLHELEEDLSNIYELLNEDANSSKDEHEDEEQIELEVYHIRGAVSDDKEEQDAGNLVDENSEEIETQLVWPEDRNIQAIRAEFDDIVDIVDRLYRLAAKLRSATARNPPSARNFYRDSYLGSDGNELVLAREEKMELRKKAKEQTERFHYRRIKEIVRQALRDGAGKSDPEETERVKPAPYDKTLAERETGSSHLATRIKLNPHAKAVVRRIATGNAYRQQQFIFWRQREWDRRNGIVGQELHSEDVSKRQALNPLIDPHTAKEFGDQGPGVPDDRKVAFSEVPSQTWKMPKERDLLSVDETRSQSSKSEQTVAPTVYEPGGRKVGWPSFPKELGGKRDFICPYCFVTCPRKYRQKSHWRSHLIQDLQPYTCTALICPEGDKNPLNTWEEWLLHEQIHHRIEYICSDHPAQSFPSREMYVKHIISVHPNREELLNYQEVDKCAQLSPKPTSGCPLCSYSANNWPDMDKHLSFHLETLGLLGLPLATGLEKDEDNMASLQLEGVASQSGLDILSDDITEAESEEQTSEHEGINTPSGETLTLNSLTQLEKRTLAARGGHEAVIGLLSDINSADFNTEDEEKSEGSETESDVSDYIPIIQAAKGGNESAISDLLAVSGVDVDAEDSRGRTSLWWAAWHGHEAVVNLFLDMGADLEAKDEFGSTPLITAAKNGHEEVVRLLLNKDANLEAQDNNSSTPLSIAARKGDKEVVRLLLRRGANLEAKDEDGLTPLITAAWNGHEEVVRLLLNKGADLEAHNGGGSTPLLNAAWNGHEAVVNLLLDSGADLEAQDKDNLTPLIAAAKNGHEEVVKLLLDKGANLEAQDNNSLTPLLISTRKGDEEVIRLLLRRGANLEAKDEDGFSPLITAARIGYKEVVRLLPNKGADLEDKDNHGLKPLLWAARHGSEEVVGLLLEWGADPVARDGQGQTPLSCAARVGHEAIAQLLLDTGQVDVDVRNDYGETPLLLAVQFEREAVVKLLLETGKVDVHAEESRGYTPLSWSIEREHEGITQLLQSYGS